ncbi:DUF2599 domain-containing protein [Mycobacterium asiaticum]|uniref:DUF2599 domain-containing protein n=1 Tax=Mycobacterium asiaticum TaxID=1790 RepID=A0A1A3C8B2_MYCAS|nr:DUF2599 domain-containing protein [Mycobacterium asiaticum]OBI82868.1 hypothetical protein A9X01_21795 [Mycobacterium asiaticum]
MKLLLLAPTMALLSMLGAPSALADAGAADSAGSSGPGYAPPYVDHTEWVSWGRGSSLRVYPTPSGRLASKAGSGHAVDAAWAEVLSQAPDGDTPGMRAQFVCHWQFAETVQPGKTSWNLEPWRPVVDDAEMAATWCNPGSPEEPF